jgi:hypothetical protein
MHLHVDWNNDRRRNNFVYAIPTKLYACSSDAGFVCTPHRVSFCTYEDVEIRRLRLHQTVKIQFPSSNHRWQRDPKWAWSDFNEIWLNFRSLNMTGVFYEDWLLNTKRLCSFTCLCWFYFIGNEPHWIFCLPYTISIVTLMIFACLFHLLFHPLYFEMAWITIMASKTNMRSPFIAIYTFTVRGFNIGCNILMHILCVLPSHIL